MVQRTIVINAIAFVAMALISSLPASAAWGKPQSFQANVNAGAAVVGKDEPANIHVISGVSRQDTLSYPGASYIAVKFESFYLPPGDKVTVRSPDNSIAYTYTNKGRADAGSFYATFILGDTAVVEYHAQATQIKENGIEAGAYGYAIPGFVRGYTPRFVESICGIDDSVPAKCYAANTTLGKTLPLAYARARAVARLWTKGTGMCTGWLAGSGGYLMTNHHCVLTPEAARLVDVELGAESDSCANECRAWRGCLGTIIATETTLVASSAEHDYALLKLSDAATEMAKSYGYLQIRPSGPVVGEPIYIAQHPAAHAKRIAAIVDGGAPATIKALGVQGYGVNRVAYAADTQGGSSGSPVISANDNFVIALHNSGGCVQDNGSSTGSNTAVDIRDVVGDLQQKGVVVPDLFAPGTAPITPVPTPSTPTPTTPTPSTPIPTTPTPTPRPGSCDRLTSVTCEATFFCSWNALKKTCQRWWK